MLGVLNKLVHLKFSAQLVAHSKGWKNLTDGCQFMELSQESWQGFEQPTLKYLKCVFELA